MSPIAMITGAALQASGCSAALALSTAVRYASEQARTRRLDSPAMAGSEDDLFGDEHVRVYRETDGERGYDWRGTTILLLTTEGRTSGQPRTTPLIHRTDGERWVIVASKGGTPENPAWYENLLAN